ncbi:MAG: cytochrome c [Gammaproteobacteria bacterium]
MNETKVALNAGVFIVTLALVLYVVVHAESATGHNEYANHCVACHGSDGKGNGPKANQLSATPADLTLLSKENGGSFPETAVYNIIDGRRVGDFHGQEMPIWGQYFDDIEGNEDAIDKRISNLIEYLKSIQVN